MESLGSSDDDGRKHHRHHHHHHHRRGRRIAAIVGAIVAVLVAVCGVCGALVCRDAMDVLDQSKDVMALAATISDDLKNGNGDELNSTVQDMASEVSSMHTKTSGPLWVAASYVPVLGDDIRVVRGVVEQADNLMQNAFVPAAQSLQGVSLSTLLTDATVDVQTLETVSAALSQAQPDFWS